MNAVYLSLGSNIEPRKNIPAAIQQMRQDFNVLSVSSVYETDPVGPAGTLKFWNLCAAVAPLPGNLLQTKIRALEARLGRIREENKFAPRTIDIDILPQKDYQRFAFIMIPLAEIAPQEKDPETGKSFLELAGLLSKEAEKFRKVEI